MANDNRHAVGLKPFDVRIKVSLFQKPEQIYKEKDVQNARGEGCSVCLKPWNVCCSDRHQRCILSVST